MTCKVEIKFPIIKKSNFSRFNPNLTLNAQVQVLEYKRNIFEISRERFDPGMIIGNSKISIKKCQFREIVKRQPEQCNCTETTRTVELYRNYRMDVLSNDCPFYFIITLVSYILFL